MASRASLTADERKGKVIGYLLSAGVRLPPKVFTARNGDASLDNVLTALSGPAIRRLNAEPMLPGCECEVRNTKQQLLRKYKLHTLSLFLSQISFGLSRSETIL